MLRNILSLVALGVLAFHVAPASAVPLTFSQQGRLLDSAGDALEGTHEVTFTLYDAASGGSVLWTETQSLELDNGFYSAVLGSDTPIAPSDLEGETLYLGIAIGSAAELPDRLELTSIPFALFAQTAENVSGGVVDASEIQIDGTTVIDADGQIDFGQLINVPDVPDSDTLAELDCTSSGDVARFDGSTWQCAPEADHDHVADDIVSGSFGIDLLPVGTTSDKVAAGDHEHSAEDVGALPSSGGTIDGTLAVTGSVQIGESGATCNGDLAGALRWNGGRVETCDGADWVTVAGDDRPRNLESDALASCKAILDAGESHGDGLYWIKPSGPAFVAWCDMTTKDGGWTQVMNVHPADGNIASFTNTAFWKGEAEYGQVENHFSNDYKSPAAWTLAATNIMVQVAEPGPNGRIIGWKAWSMPVRGFDGLFDLADNTTVTSGVIGQDVGAVYAYEPLIKNGTNLQANRRINPNNDRVRLGVDGYARQGDDNQPGLGTQMNESSCGVGRNCYRFRDVELWVDSGSNLWCTLPTEGSYKWIGSDGGCGSSCGDCDTNASPGYHRFWTYRIYVR